MYPNVEGKNMRASLPLLVRTYEGYACIKKLIFQKHFVLNRIDLRNIENIMKCSLLDKTRN